MYESRSPAAHAVSLCLLLLSGWLQPTSGQISVQILPNVRNEARFQGQDFTRLCSIVGTTDPVIFEWLHNNAYVVHSGTGLNLELSLPEVDFANEGSYSCRAILGDSSVIGPADAGDLVVLDRGMINAPPVQYVVHGTEYSQLNCTYPGAIATWTRGNDVVSGELITPSFADEGLYTCDLFISDSVRQVQASTQEWIRLHVFVPVAILSGPPPYIPIAGNPPLTLTLAFSGRQAQNMSINWYRDDIPIPTNRINTTYSPSQLSGTTELKFPSVTRSNEGVYRVVIRSELGYGVLDQTEAETSFQLDVEVPPATPSDFRFQDVYSTSVLSLWSLTNQNADEGADQFILHLTYDNGTLFRNETFPGGVSERRVTNLIPGINYSALLIAENVDGVTSVGPTTFQTLVGAPMLTVISVDRLNGTHFTTTASLAYTGGGSISDLNIHVTSSSNSQELTFRIPATQSPDFGLVWTGEFSVTNPAYVPEGRLEFLVSAVNQFGFSSEGFRTVVPPHNPGTTPTTQEPSTTTEPALSDPLWLIIFAVILGTVIVTIVIVTLCLVTVCYCKRAHKATNKYNVNKTQNLSAEENSLQGDNPMVTRTDSSDKNLSNSLRNGSVPSIETSLHSIQPEVRYVEDKKFRHKRNLSDASSKASSNRGHQPSTASNSPSNLLKAKIENERNLYTEGSFISLSNINEQAVMDEVQSQYSQTESENIQRQQFPTNRNNMYHNSNLGLTNSTCSSVQSSHQSLPINALPPRIYSQQQLEPPLHTHRRNYSDHYKTPSISSSVIEEASDRYQLESSTSSSGQFRRHAYSDHHLTPSISSSIMEGRATSESICTCSGGNLTPEHTRYNQPKAYPTDLISDV